MSNRKKLILKSSFQVADSKPTIALFSTAKRKTMYSKNKLDFELLLKPCFGFFVLKLENEAEEIKKLRDQYKKDKNVKKLNEV